MQELSIRPSDEYEPNFQLLLARTVYDIIFFVVVTTLGLNIVIAILVDRFSEMREETVSTCRYNVFVIMCVNTRIKLMMIIELGALFVALQKMSLKGKVR